MGGITRTPADIAFSKCVREAASWVCQRCFNRLEVNSMGLHCAHFQTRGKWGTRFEPDNVAALCYGCHSYLDSHPYEKTAWFETHIGKARAAEVMALSEKPAYGMRSRKAAIAKHFRLEHERLLGMRSEGVTSRIGIRRFNNDL